MLWIAAAIVAFIALLFAVRVSFRRTSQHSMAQLTKLGTVSRRWLYVHRAADR